MIPPRLRGLLLAVLTAGALLAPAVVASAQVEAAAEEGMGEEETPLADASTGARWVWYLGVFAVIGACGIRLVGLRALRPEGPAGALELVAPAERRARALALAGALLLLPAAGARLYLQARAFLMPDEPFGKEAVDMVLDTPWGAGWRLQAAAAAMAVLALAAAGPRRRPAWWLGGMAALALAAVTPLTGHALDAPWPAAVTVPMQAAHVLAGGLWLGTLLGLLVVGYGVARGLEPIPRALTVAALVRAFSPLALAGAALAVALGVALGYVYVGSFAALLGTVYGRALLVKSGLLLLVAALGAYNWRRVTPVLEEAHGPDRMHRSATLEAVVGALLLAITAALVALPSPHM